MAHLFPRVVLATMAFVIFASFAAAAANDELELARRITAAQVPLEKLPEADRRNVAEILDKASSVYSRSSATAFPDRKSVV